MESTQGTNIHVLEDTFFETEGWFIYGCTLWSDMALGGDWQDGAALAGERMNDYKRIRKSAQGYKKLRPLDTRLIHSQSLSRMRHFFGEHDPARTIVVTHHSPSALSLPEHRRADPISCAYASSLDNFILQYQPPLWIHGHIHHNNDYHIGRTRIIANPQAYPGEENPNFVRNMILELPN